MTFDEKVLLNETLRSIREDKRTGKTFGSFKIESDNVRIELIKIGYKIGTISFFISDGRKVYGLTTINF